LRFFNKLTEGAAGAADWKTFDVFLSHSFKDAPVILGIKTLLENRGLSVYVDWVDDPDLDRGNVTVATADRLRSRMRQSKSLIYAHSNNSPTSKWMSWEVGYFDGLKGAVAILPVAQTSSESFGGQEFLGLYPYIDKTDLGTLWVNRGRVSKSQIGAGAHDFVNMKEWMEKKASASMY
jgi:hypothetical protein